jgi:hypothetical protein
MCACILVCMHGSNSEVTYIHIHIIYRSFLCACIRTAASPKVHTYTHTTHTYTHAESTDLFAAHAARQKHLERYIHTHTYTHNTVSTDLFVAHAAGQQLQRHAAARHIQAAYRGSKCRRKLKKQRTREFLAVIRLQAWVRGQVGRKFVRNVKNRAIVSHKYMHEQHAHTLGRL